MDLPLEGRISGPSTGFEVTVPGRQGIRAMRNSIPLAGAPTSIETSLRGLLLFPVPSRGVAAAPRALLTCRAGCNFLLFFFFPRNCAPDRLFSALEGRTA